MGLEYPGEWKFAGTDEIPAVPRAVVGYIHQQLVRVAQGATDEWEIVERFKTAFRDTSSSSSHSYAVSDLDRAMSRPVNAVVFLDSLWTALEVARESGLAVPTESQINEVLRRNAVGYELRPPKLVRSTGDAVISPTAEAASARTGDRYILGDLLGQGGFGEVFAATRETSAATFEVALKRLNPSAFVDRDRAIQRFRREVGVLQGLQHRGIVPYVDAGIDHEGRPYLVMPRIRGPNVRDWAEGKAFGDAVAIMAEVLLAISYAHSRQVLHRDLKPSNVLVRETDGQAVVLDFGNAYVLDELDGPSLTSTAVGSLGYIPPEVQANPTLRTPGQDLFAVAVMVYELIARRRPNPQEYVPLGVSFGTPVGLDDVLRQALGPSGTRAASAEALRCSLLAASSAR